MLAMWPQYLAQDRRPKSILLSIVAYHLFVTSATEKSLLSFWITQPRSISCVHHHFPFSSSAQAAPNAVPQLGSHAIGISWLEPKKRVGQFIHGPRST
ncbi:hypothetical protein L227DRAFT_383191 [Lentinus tigrinus ALCF2SS1-6]|uniref:Uncharacterized protein n=1 Tax=Lentinus tigrinus ALCF2SS1-6 TaxID=1328759 RepID=A0A5C2RPV3_9APHY|nr:hypothetical protein L227DRAFT_383191 [Lentinus tigrinus ALCF2SS1-6]